MKLQLSPLGSLLCYDSTLCQFCPALQIFVIMKIFGDQVSVNCTTSATNISEMGWEASVGATGMKNSSWVTWMVEKLIYWTVQPMCFVNLENGVQCFESPAITVYKNPDTVTVSAVTHGPVMEGETYKLRCDIINVAPVQNLTVRWYKDHQIIKTDFFTNKTKTPVNESSTLTVNISRRENGVQFKCEALMDFGPPTPVTSNTHSVSVHYAPELNNQTADLYVREGNDVPLTCEAEGKPSPSFYWTCDGMTMSESTNSLIIPQVNTSATYTCTATNYLGNITKQIHIHMIKNLVPKGPEPVPTTTSAPYTADAHGECSSRLFYLLATPNPRLTSVLH
uniref:Ig-like domain-containing protein n=1 Tax=Monopterus albus TaxID=43700 RepID=A0A3Q3JS41_MONAL